MDANTHIYAETGGKRRFENGVLLVLPIGADHGQLLAAQERLRPRRERHLLRPGWESQQIAAQLHHRPADWGII